MFGVGFAVYQYIFSVKPIFDKENELATAKVEINELSNEIKEKNSEALRLQNDIKNSTTLSEELKSDVTNLQKEKEQLSAQVERSKLEISELQSNIADTRDNALEAYLYKHVSEIMNDLLLENLYDKNTLSKSHSLLYVEEALDKASIENVEKEALNIIKEYAETTMPEDSYETTDIYGALIYYAEKNTNMP
ncbi:hypothetical protein [Paenibacillus sp. Marseille-Q4541]|nr:hypothetical protein [Paenibacillus sp. Marseille-Q4541]